MDSQEQAKVLRLLGLSGNPKIWQKMEAALRLAEKRPELAEELLPGGKEKYRATMEFHKEMDK